MLATSLGTCFAAIFLLVGVAYAEERSPSPAPRMPAAEDEKIAAAPRASVEKRVLAPPQEIIVEGVGRMRRNAQGDFEPVAARPISRAQRDERQPAPPTAALSRTEFEAFMATSEPVPAPEREIEPALQAQFERFLRERSTPREPPDLTRQLNARQIR
jgi:hypothetical protein